MMTIPIKEYLTNLIPQEQRWKITLFNLWDDIMGPLKDKVSIAQINGDTLLLKVIHPAWAQELFLLSSMLKQKINTRLEAPYIKNIRFVNSDIKTHKPHAHYSYLVGHKRKTYTEHNVVLSSKEEVILVSVHDPELKRALTNFFVRCKHLAGHSYEN